MPLVQLFLAKLRKNVIGSIFFLISNHHFWDWATVIWKFEKMVEIKFFAIWQKKIQLQPQYCRSYLRNVSSQKIDILQNFQKWHFRAWATSLLKCQIYGWWLSVKCDQQHCTASWICLFSNCKKLDFYHFPKFSNQRPKPCKLGKCHIFEFFLKCQEGLLRDVSFHQMSP